VPGHTG